MNIKNKKSLISGLALMPGYYLIFFKSGLFFKIIGFIVVIIAVAKELYTEPDIY